MSRKAVSSAKSARRQLGLPGRLTIEGLHSYLEQSRGRPIVVQTMQSPSADRQICGLWIETEEYDYIFHADAASELHRRQILLHEYAHMLMHHNEHDVPGDSVATLFPDLDAETVVRVLSRGNSTSMMEAEAEALADLMAVEMHRHRYALQEPGNLRRLGL